MKVYAKNDNSYNKIICYNPFSEKDDYYIINDDEINKIKEEDIDISKYTRILLNDINIINKLLNKINLHIIQSKGVDIHIFKDVIKLPDINLSKLENLINYLDISITDNGYNFPICFDFLNDDDLMDTHHKALRVKDILETIGYRTGLVICNLIDDDNISEFVKDYDIIIFINHKQISLTRLNYIWDFILDTTNKPKKIICNIPVDNNVKNKMVFLWD